MAASMCSSIQLSPNMLSKCSGSGGGIGYLPMAISTSESPTLQISDWTVYCVPCNRSGYKTIGQHSELNRKNLFSCVAVIYLSLFRKLVKHFQVLRFNRSSNQNVMCKYTEPVISFRNIRNTRGTAISLQKFIQDQGLPATCIENRIIEKYLN